MRHPLLVGVDTHRKDNHFHCLDPSGDSLAAFHVRNNRPGTNTAVEQLVALLNGGDFDGLRLAAEATGWYWLPFFEQLGRMPELESWPRELYAFNPRVTARYRDTFLDMDKDDPEDAYVLTDRLRLGRELPHPFVFDATTLALRLLTRLRYRLTQQLVMTKLYALNFVYLKASDYTLPSTAAFRDTFSATSMAVLSEFGSLDTLVAMPLEELMEWLNEKGRHHFADVGKTAERLQALARTSYQLPETLLASINLGLRLLLVEVRSLERLRTQVDHAIEAQVAERPNPLATIPGIGPVFAAGILAEIGDVRRFEGDEAKVAKFAGFKWRKTKSAEHRSEETPLTRRGNRYLRYYLCEAANIVRTHDAEYALYYQKKYDEVARSKHKRAVTLTARKLVRLVVRLLTTGEAYQARGGKMAKASAGSSPAETNRPDGAGTR
jgi:hypothetical protein